MRRALHIAIFVALASLLYAAKGTAVAKDSYEFIRHNRRGAAAGILALYGAVQVAGRRSRPRWRIYAAVPASLAFAMVHAKLAEAAVSFPLAEQAVLIGAATAGAVGMQAVADWLKTR